MHEKVSSPAPVFRRNQAIDIFRGATIVLMVFYTVTGVLSDQLPYFAAHNFVGQFHPGDLILPMFLFASGMSLSFFEKKRLKVPAPEFRKLVLKRLGILLLVSVSFSTVVAGYYFGMDEVMLNLLLFIPSLFLVRFSDRVLLLACFGIILLHFGIFEAGLLPDYTKVYLGGYPGAFWYLPVMLGGILCARNQERIAPYLYMFGAATIVLMYFCMPYKMNLYPSFITLSIAWGFLFFELSKLVRSDFLIFCGKTPLRFWCYQVLFFVIPAKAYCLSNGRWHPVGVSGNAALLYGVLAVIVVAGVSKGYEMHRVFSRYLGEREAAARQAATNLKTA